MLHRKVKIATKEHLGDPLLVIWLYIQPFLLFSQEITFNLHCSSQYPFAQLQLALQDSRVEYRDGYFRNWDYNSYSEIVGTFKVEGIRIFLIESDKWYFY